MTLRRSGALPGEAEKPVLLSRQKFPWPDEFS